MNKIKKTRGNQDPPPIKKILEKLNNLKINKKKLIFIGFSINIRGKKKKKKNSNQII